jgi:adenylate cyclase
MLEIAFHNPRQHNQFRCETGPIVLARAQDDADVWSAVERHCDSASALIEIALAADGVSLATKGCNVDKCCDALGVPARPQRMALPASFTIGDTRFEIAAAGVKASVRKLRPLSNEAHGFRPKKSTAGSPSPATLSRWFAALSSLNHWATSLQELYVQAAKCAVEAVGLDGGIVLRRRDGALEIAASHLPHPELGIHYEVDALDQLVRQPQTLFHGGSTSTAENEPAIVLSPLRNAAGELVGAVYGYRSVRQGNARRTIRYLEAHMIELLAGAVSEGIARIEREAETDRRRVLLEQAAAASQHQTVREIGTEEREVTLLFADLRNSTALSASLEANETYELLSQVMECLTAAVLDHDGLIIDYYGDGLAAMWNAPADQADHAELACRAALRMLQTLTDVSSDWSNLLEQELQLGIGIHTGLAHVGNTGSRRRTKYGPRGTNVNLTSRLEAATKQLELPLVVTEQTARRLSGRFNSHRICRAHLPGIQQPIDLYAVDAANSAANSSSAWQAYDKALQSFEQGRLNEAADMLAAIDRNVCEVPSRFLKEQIDRELSRTHRRRRSDRDSGNSRGVIRLSAK